MGDGVLVGDNNQLHYYRKRCLCMDVRLSLYNLCGRNLNSVDDENEHLLIIQSISV